MSVDFSEVMFVDMEERDKCQAFMNYVDALEAQTQTLNLLADKVEALPNQNEDTEEIIELLRYSADHDPISETVEYLVEQAQVFLSA